MVSGILSFQCIQGQSKVPRSVTENMAYPIFDGVSSFSHIFPLEPAFSGDNHTGFTLISITSCSGTHNGGLLADQHPGFIVTSSGATVVISTVDLG